MKIKLKLNEINKPISDLIDENLGSAGLPVCFGNMCPPIITNEILDEDVEYINLAFSVEPDDKSEVEVNKITNSPEHLQTHKFVVRKAGIIRLEKIKKSMAKKYSEHLIRCSTCKLTDTCYKLSKLYTDDIKFIEGISSTTPA